jgi:hypothetical protein
MMRRLGLLLALAVIVTMIMIVSAMPAMAEKPAFSGASGHLFMKAPPSIWSGVR